MSHTIKEKKKLLARVGRIRGQVEALERALAEETECGRIMHMIAGIRGGERRAWPTRRPLAPVAGSVSFWPPT